ncbi:MAG: fumarylacetoacetate hydrolase family protein [Bacteroidetes bacterium]|nr:fumarylacetoacetate hydrolase family protein [Bacteroidota bacterium]
MTIERIEELAAIVDDAAMNVTEIGMLTADEPELDIEAAYAVQEASIERRLARGERLVGMKMGLTSRAKMEQMGVHEPIYGRLTSSMIVNDGARVRLAEMLHARVEPEVAFILADDIEGPVTPAQALASVAGVCAALEIIDSRYRDFKFTLPDVIADNTSAIRFVLGSTLMPAEAVNLGNLGIVMEINGRIIETGSSSAIYDHPARSLAELANMLARTGGRLEAGQIVLSGGATAAHPLNAGDRVRVTIDEIGSAEFRCE